jgi:hypothetical protein
MIPTGNRPLALAALLLAGPVASLAAQPAGPGPAFVALGPLPDRTIDGWVTSVRGQRFDYHSAHPTLRTSLLVRSLDSAAGAAWLSEPAPSGDGPVRLAFLAAMDVTEPGQPPVEFHLTVDGRHRLVIPQPADTADWSIEDPSGAALSFHRLMVDKFGDGHGRFLLTVPRAWVTPGKPIELAIHGPSAGRMSWFILYLVGMRPSVAVVPEQALLRSPRGPRQSIRLDLWNPWDPFSLTATLDGRAEPAAVVPTGGSSLRLPAPVVSVPTTVRLSLAAAGRESRWNDLRLEPVVRREFHLINHAHLDIGYTAHQDEVLQRTWAGYDSAIALASRTRHYPAGARFRWNVEGLWPLEEMMARDSVRARGVLGAVARGDLVLNGNYANLMMGLSSARELEMMFETARRLRAAKGLSITTAMTSDVPGFPAALIPILARSGIRWLSSGPNYQPALPMEGDRIGHTLARLGDRPFWWRSLDGRDSVLVMMAGRGYSWMHRFPAGRIRLEDASFLTEYAAALTRDRNPYQVVQVRIAYGGDNGMPDPRLPDEVRRWNERFESPRLVISTLPEMFRRFEQRYGASIPRLRGDFTGYWEDGAMSTAREQVLTRRAAARLEAAGSAAKGRGVTLDRALVWRAWKEVLLWDEHTWGADRSVSDPDAADVVAQWRWKEARARAADSLSRLVAADRGGADRRPGPAAATRLWVTSDSIGNGLVTVRLDRTTGAITSLRWRGHELADARRGGIARYRYLPGWDTTKAVDATVRQVSILASAPDLARLEVRSEAPGAASLVETITLRAGSREVEIAITIDKEAVRAKESVHLGFALDIPAAIIRFDPAGTLVRADRDQLPAANRNLVQAMSLVDASNRGFGLTIATPDAPLWQIGGLTAEAFKRDDGTEGWLDRTLPGSELVGYLMNNYWHTNFKADQAGPVTFRFVLRPHGPFDSGEAKRFAERVRLSP